MTKSELADLSLDQEWMILLSLKPRFADVVLAGKKTVELRRAEPKIVVPTRALIYSTSPVRALVGTCIVTSVETDHLEDLWQRFGPRTGINRREFSDYFEGVGKGSALMLSGPDVLLRPVPLARLRETSQVLWFRTSARYESRHVQGAGVATNYWQPRRKTPPRCRRPRKKESE